MPIPEGISLSDLNTPWNLAFLKLVIFSDCLDYGLLGVILVVSFIWNIIVKIKSKHQERYNTSDFN
jgi:hypothetical protein